MKDPADEVLCVVDAGRFEILDRLYHRYDNSECEGARYARHGGISSVREHLAFVEEGKHDPCPVCWPGDVLERAGQLSIYAAAA